MDWLANAGHLIIRLIIWCALPMGIWAGAFGVWLRKRYEGHQEMLVNYVLLGRIELIELQMQSSYHQ